MHKFDNYENLEVNANAVQKGLKFLFRKAENVIFSNN